LALLLTAGPAEARTVELTIASRPQFADGGLSVDVVITNRGDEPAVALGVRLRALGQVIDGPRRMRLEPNRVWSGNLTLPVGSLGEGRWLYVLELDYAKRDGYPQHGIHADTFVVGSPPQPNVAVGTLAAAPLASSSVLRAEVRYGGGRARTIDVAVHAPAGLAAPAPRRTVSVGGGESAWVEFALVNRTEVPWSRPPVYVSLEYDEGGIHQSVLARLVLEIVPSLFWLTRWRRPLWTVAGLAALAWLAAAGWAAATSRDGTTSRDWAAGRAAAGHGGRFLGRLAAARRVLRFAIDAAAVGAASGFICALLPWSQILEPTTPAGGDTASHYYAAVYLRDALLPRGRVTGWCPGAFAGFPLFQLYFPLPFVLMAALSVAAPVTMEVAFKLVTTLGPVALPACAYTSLRLLGAPFPGPALGAVLSLCFLFLEANSMWGGNLTSTLAGEFTYAIALDLGLLFIGVLGRVMRVRRGRTVSGVLLAAIGLSHGYVLLWAGFVSLLELLPRQERSRRFVTLLAVHGLAVLLMAFWLVPLLWYAPWTTSYDPVATFESWHVALPRILEPAAALASIFGALALLVGWRRGRADLRPLAILWGGIAIALGLYALAPAVGIVDVRFLPFAQLGLCLAAAAALGSVLGRLAAPEAWPVVALVAALPFVHAQVRVAPFQAVYNYSGFEQKAGWPVYRRIAKHLRGGAGDPRVAYEHSLEAVTFGTERAFENLPLFSGRSTLDGLYMQSSATAPFVYYAQSEISLESTCPLPDWGCARPDLDRGLGHLEMLNVSHLIARSPDIKAAAGRHPQLVRDLEAEEYEVFRLRRNDGRYVVPLAAAPVLVRTAAWKEAAFRWFKYAGADAPMPVFSSRSADGPDGAEGTDGPDGAAGTEAGFAGAFDEVPAEPPRVVLPPPPAVEEEVEADRLRVRGCRPGHPLLIRISYHPRWRARTGEKIWQAGPNLMLVFPRAETLELEFGSPVAVLAGRGATALGLVIVLVGIVSAWVPARTATWASRHLPAAVRHLPAAVRGVARLGAALGRRAERMPVSRAGRWPARAGTLPAVALTLVLALGLALTAAMIRRAAPSQHRLYLQAQALYKAGRLDEALPLFQRAQHGPPLSRFVTLGRYFEAMIHSQRERWEAARRGFASVLAEFPEAITAPAAAYHLGVCEARLGDVDAARGAWERAMREFPGTPWANLAAERTGELRR
jgi:hypothetical protein